MNHTEYDNLIERVKTLRDCINEPRSTDPYVLSILVRETVTLIIHILETERDER